jgi:hypothetical protein
MRERQIRFPPLPALLRMFVDTVRAIDAAQF